MFSYSSSSCVYVLLLCFNSRFDSAELLIGCCTAVSVTVSVIRRPGWREMLVVFNGTTELRGRPKIGRPSVTCNPMITEYRNSAIEIEYPKQQNPITGHWNSNAKHQNGLNTKVDYSLSNRLRNT